MDNISFRHQKINFLQSKAAFDTGKKILLSFRLTLYYIFWWLQFCCRLHAAINTIWLEKTPKSSNFPQIKKKDKGRIRHCVKSVTIRSFSGLYFPAFGLNTEIYGVNLRNSVRMQENANQENSKYRRSLRS